MALGVEKVLPLRLKTAKGVALVLACLAASTGVELALLYYGFLAPGLKDTYIWYFGLWTHLIPAFSILALTVSWLHLVRSFFFEPRKPIKRAKARARRKKRKKRWPLRLPSFSKISQALAYLKTRAERYLGRLGTAFLKGLGILLLGACAAFMAAALLAYWHELYVLSGSLAKGSPVFSWLVFSLADLGKAITSIEQMKWLVEQILSTGASMNKAVRPVALAIMKADPIYKYAVAQNLLVWFSGLAALAYRRPPVKRR